MPGAHRQTDQRYCTGRTIVINQSTVFVNDKLWAVKGDIVGTHGGAGNLLPIYGALNVYVENKLIIVAPGDSASSVDNLKHPIAVVRPWKASEDTFIYDSAGGGISV